MNKKLVYGILIVCILAIIVIDLFVLYGPNTTQAPEISEVIINTDKTEYEVIINTDKTEYEQGESVKIIVTNNLNKSVWYYEAIACGLSFWILQKKVNSNWEDVESTKYAPCMWFARPPPKELKPGESIKDSWNMHKYFGAEIYNDPEKLGFVEPGTYRFAFDYYTNCTTTYLYDCEGRVRIYSNQFTIK